RVRGDGQQGPGAPQGHRDRRDPARRGGLRMRRGSTGRRSRLPGRPPGSRRVWAEGFAWKGSPPARVDRAPTRPAPPAPPPAPAPPSHPRGATRRGGVALMDPRPPRHHRDEGHVAAPYRPTPSGPQVAALRDDPPTAPGRILRRTWETFQARLRPCLMAYWGA